jgi:hypothetical protein
MRWLVVVALPVEMRDGDLEGKRNAGGTRRVKWIDLQGQRHKHLTAKAKKHLLAECVNLEPVLHGALVLIFFEINILKFQKNLKKNLRCR